MSVTGPSVTLRPAAPDDLDSVAAMLAANDLPNEDVRSKPEAFYLGVADGEVVGIGGLERFGSAGLLRSVVVTEGARGRGYGSAICDELERLAAQEGVDTLYLLTTTAAGFFRGRGYEEVDRAAAPASIRETSEFAELCPESAVCLRTELE